MAKQITQKILKLNVVFQPEPVGGYTVLVPSLPGCVTYGKTLEEARKMAVDAISGFIECMKEDGEEIPNDELSFVSTLSFKYPRVAAI